jgi:hypothetical protein
MQNEYLKFGEKKKIFCATNFKLLSQKEYSTNNCDYFSKFMGSVGGDHCDCSPQAPKPNYKIRHFISTPYTIASRPPTLIP